MQAFDGDRAPLMFDGSTMFWTAEKKKKKKRRQSLDFLFKAKG